MKELVVVIALIGAVNTFSMTEAINKEVRCDNIESAKMRLSSPYRPNSIGYKEYGESIDFDEPIKEMRAMGYVSIAQSSKDTIIDLDYSVEIEFERELKHSFTNGKLNMNGAFQFTDMYSNTNKWNGYVLKKQNNSITYFTMAERLGSCSGLIDCFNPLRGGLLGYDIQLITVNKDAVKLETTFLNLVPNRNMFNKPSGEEVRSLLLAHKAESIRFEAVFNSCN